MLKHIDPDAGPAPLLGEALHTILRRWPMPGYSAELRLDQGRRIVFRLRPDTAGSTLLLTGEEDGAAIHVVFEPDGNSVRETVTVSAPPGSLLSGVRVGMFFLMNELAGFRLHPLPFKIDLRGQDQSRPVEEVGIEPRFAEGWILEDGVRGLIVMRLPSADESTCFVPAMAVDHLGEPALQIGSIGNDPQGHQSRSAFVGRAPGQAGLTFPATVFTYYDGGWEEGVRIFRKNVDAAVGSRMGTYRSVPLTYNTYHDFGPSYTRPQLEPLLPKLRELGIGLLHLDPGWETFWGSACWDDERMGDPEDFLHLAAGFGMQTGCWTSLHTREPEKLSAFCALNPDGNSYVAEDFGEVKLTSICPVSGWRRHFETNMGRLLDAGLAFVNSDFHDWPWNGQSCHSAFHTHGQPPTRTEWALAVNEAFAALKRRKSGLTVEMHDHVESGEYRTPVWYLYGRENSYDEKWAYEFMWTTYQDLLSHKLFALYHLRKSEPVPLFLHMNMATDNPNALAFWYVASCVNHVGIGGVRKAPPDVYDGYVKAARIYNEHFVEMTVGEFVGIDEVTHLHVAPDRSAGLLLCFNLTENPQTREVSLDLARRAPDLAAAAGPVDPVHVRIDPLDVAILPLRFEPSSG